MKKRSTECETVFGQTKGNLGFRRFHLRRKEKVGTECETVFGQTKGNLKFRRFNLRGKEKVGTEWGLLMLGYDFKQLIRLMNA